jgi:3-oxoacyl-[acyl-carrier-protein] synthase-3
VAADIDLIIVATSTPDMVFPSTACMVQHKLGIVGCPAFDVQAVCSGFVYALTVADSLIRTASARRALVIGAEVFSRILDFDDRTTCVLFGDGAGAVVLEASNASVGIESIVLHSDGSKAELLWVQAGATRVPASKETVEKGLHFIRMAGGDVFRLAVRSMADAAEEAIADAGLTVADIQIVIPHQANLRIIEGVAKRLRIPMDKVFVNIQKYGNTSSATIPIAIAEAEAIGRLRRGDKVLLVAFGGGFTWGAAVLEWFGAPIADRREKSLVERASRQLEELVDRVRPLS